MAAQATQGGSFKIGHCAHLNVKPSSYMLGRDCNSPADDSKLITLSCDLLGGDENDEWIVNVDLGLRGPETGEQKAVAMKTWDM